jgi:hypothetical protein
VREAWVSAKGATQGLWVGFDRARRGRRGDNREQWPSMAMGGHRP